MKYRRFSYGDLVRRPLTEIAEKYTTVHIRTVRRRVSRGCTVKRALSEQAIGKFTYKDLQDVSLPVIVEKYGNGINIKTVYKRIERGYSIEEALTKQVTDPYRRGDFSFKHLEGVTLRMIWTEFAAPGISYSRLSCRLRHNWTMESALGLAPKTYNY